MTPRAKEILRQSISVYKGKSELDKEVLVSMVKDNLSIHYDSFAAIGMGLDEDKVRAGEIFLRIFNK
jgi:hypothetical protein